VGARLRRRSRKTSSRSDNLGQSLIIERALALPTPRAVRSSSSRTRSSRAPRTLGATTSTASSPFGGNLQEVAVYPSALSATQILPSALSGPPQGTRLVSEQARDSCMGAAPRARTPHLDTLRVDSS